MVIGLLALAAAASGPPPKVSHEQAIVIARAEIARREQGRDVTGVQTDVASKGHTWRVTFVPPLPRLGGASVVKVDKQTGKVTGYHHDD